MTNGYDIFFETEINGEEINISATPLSKSDNEKIIYFDGNIESDSYEIVTISYEENIEDSVVFFNNYMQQNNLEDGGLLKIYLKDNNSNDYLVLESFNYEMPYDLENLSDLKIDGMPGSWVAREFLPISSEVVNDPLARGRDIETVIESFNMGDQRQMHYLKLEFNVDSEDIPIGHKASFTYGMTVIDNYFEVAGKPNVDTEDKSAIFVDEVTVRANSIPGSAYYSLELDGEVTKNDSIVADASADLNIFESKLLSLIGLSLDYEYGGQIDFNENNELFNNSPSANRFTRAIEVTLDNQYDLYYIDNNFLIGVEVQDYNEEYSSGEEINVEWEYTTENYYTFKTSTYVNSVDEPVNIE